MNIKFNIFKKYPKLFTRFFKSLYKHKLDYNITELTKKGLCLDIVYDVGAYQAEWSNNYIKKSLKKKNFFLFEANKTNENYLKKSGFKYFIEVLSDEKKRVKFYSKKLTGDSYYREQSERYNENYELEIRETKTLDEIIKREKLPLPNFIKIDTQGSEIDILKGTKKSLTNCNLIYLETPIIEYNSGAPSLNESIDYLKSINFIPYDICEVHYMDKILIQIDILYIRKDFFYKIFPGEKSINFYKED